MATCTVPILATHTEHLYTCCSQQLVDSELHTLLHVYTLYIALICYRLILCSNRAECYLQTNQPRNAIRDCTRALAMNPFNMKVCVKHSDMHKRLTHAQAHTHTHSHTHTRTSTCTHTHIHTHIVHATAPTHW